MENKGAKGHAMDHIRAGETKVLFDVKGSGIIHRMWVAFNDRSPEMLRSLKIILAQVGGREYLTIVFKAA